MHRNRSSSKRPYSPSLGVEGRSPKVAQFDGSSNRKTSTSGDERERGSEELPNSHSTLMPTFLTLSDSDLREKYAELVKLENQRLLASRQDPEGKWARLTSDPTLDRYSNIHPWSQNRVKLHVPEGVNDYINASPVTLPVSSETKGALNAGISDKYICMQGPKRETIDHVWHMIWHEVATPHESSPAVVIMLSPTHAPMPEYGNRLFEKCYQYFPKDDQSPPLQINESGILGDDFKATVKFVSREPDISGTAIEIRQLLMTVEGDEKEKVIWHYLYPNWPDYGALEEENVSSILTLMELTRNQNGTGENPRLIHCSAGVGRTGTFIALEFLVGELRGGAWDDWNESEKAGTDPIFETVNQLREQRKTMVQSFEQYVFLYHVLKNLWEEKHQIPSIRVSTEDDDDDFEEPDLGDDDVVSTEPERTFV